MTKRITLLMGRQEVPTIPPGYRQKGYHTTTGVGGYLFHAEGFKLLQQDGGGIILSDPAIPAVYIGEVGHTNVVSSPPKEMVNG